LAAADPFGGLWSADPDRCCALRKAAPLERALAGFDAWISGRKRHQSATRAALPAFESDAAGRLKANPLAAWSADAVEAYRVAHDLPAHPLVAEGFPSIGCRPCTSRVLHGEDARAGRWRGLGKTECGIHRPRPAATNGPLTSGIRP
jgi:phosphoadenosine phosphosulfate reductase